MIRKYLQKIYLALIFILLYAPIVTLVVLSFNQSKTRAKWGGFTLKWYTELFQNEQIMNAFYTTLIIAFISAAVATLIGTAAAIAIQGMKQKWKTMYMGITNIPMMNAEIVMGVSLMLLFIAFHMTLGFGTILIAHITFNIPYVILSVAPKLKQTNRYTYEAALDLGASPLKAFFKVVFPDIVPGVLSGFMMAFTMSLDDFVITHFTKGPGIDTLSTKIYTEVRKGIKPEIYALSTIMFATVLVLLLLVNYSPKEEEEAPVRKKVRRPSKVKKIFIQRVIPVAICIIFIGGGFYYAKEGGVMGSEELIVYNWGEYIDPDVLTMFEEETGIHVVYEEFETNEILYPKISSGAIAYDVVCPSDYMIQRMIDNDLLSEINFDNIPNLKNIGKQYLEQSRQFDPENKYSVPYCWGTVGILYNKTMVDEPVDSWSILWNPKYKDNILMQDSVRDAFGATLKYLGYSLNSTDLDELNEAKNLLIEQKPLVQAYVIDQVRDKMIGNEAALGVIYSGEAIYTQKENPNLEYVIPKEGSNIWIDSWVIPKNAEHKENAEKFINFLCRPDIALKNFEYITYSTPNEAARELIEDESIRNSEIAFPDLSRYDNLETFQYLGTEADQVYGDLWNKVKSS
ncbi:extracellular solute-binding protein [Blautia glucerasea]|uniref:extracellular solute-binding protein n=1 Tax=Blautia glucerasea TaxID=536633 RepID=UPI001D09576B|nr:extracellular solute-binding protein [Blautia glucerasea]MCB6544212.1 extracellular solute-binding protein [Blautia glucerasea]